MSDSRATAAKRPRGWGFIIVLLVVVAAVLAAAYYQEEIGFFFKLKAWDRDAPGRTVGEFLTAGREGREEASSRLVGDPNLRPLRDGGKFTGYTLATNAGVIDMRFAELAPVGDIKPTSVSFIMLGKGAAEVKCPDRSGTPVTYRLEMQDGGWKITEIRGGRPRGTGSTSGGSPGSGPAPGRSRQ